MRVTTPLVQRVRPDYSFVPTPPVIRPPQRPVDVVNSAAHPQRYQGSTAQLQGGPGSVPMVSQTHVSTSSMTDLLKSQSAGNASISQMPLASRNVSVTRSASAMPGAWSPMFRSAGVSSTRPNSAALTQGLTDKGDGPRGEAALPVVEPNLPGPSAPVPAMSAVSQTALNTPDAPVATIDPSVIQLSVTGAMSGHIQADSRTEDHASAPARPNSGFTIVEYVPPTQRPKAVKIVDKTQMVGQVAFIALLRCCSSAESEEALKAMGQLKELAKGESGLARVYISTKEWLASYHASFVKRVQAEGGRFLEAELYASWLAECRSLVTVMYVRTRSLPRD